MQPKYANSVIYKIVCLDPTITDLYVGSTTNPTRRKNAHKTVCNNPWNKNHNLYVYRFIRDNGGFDNWQFVVIRRYKNIETKEQLLKKERKYVDKLKPTLNKQVPMQTSKESCRAYYRKNRETLIDAMKQYDTEHKEQLKAKWGQKIECECGITYTLRHKNRHRNTQRHKQLMGEL